MKAVYAIRHQVAGIIINKLYVKPPSAEEIELVRLAHHRPGKDCWVRVIQIPIDVPQAIAKHFAAAPAVEPEPEPTPAKELPRFVIRATGTVKNPS